MTDPTSAIKPEVSQLVELQIQAFRQDSSLTTSELLQYRMRAEKIRILYQELIELEEAVSSSHCAEHPSATPGRL